MGFQQKWSPLIREYGQQRLLLRPAAGGQGGDGAYGGDQGGDHETTQSSDNVNEETPMEDDEMGEVETKFVTGFKKLVNIFF